MKKYYEPASTLHTTTWYSYGAQPGTVLAVYEKGANGALKVIEHTIYGSSRLGIDRREVTYTTDTVAAHDTLFTRDLRLRAYELNDHLGNVRVTISDMTIPSLSHQNADVLAAVDYYPFGMQMHDRTTNGGDYRYGFNGKENDNDVKGDGNQQDYGFRIYDPRIARFLSVDPLTREYPWYTPYQFAGNKPVWALDRDGLEELIYLYRYDQSRNISRYISSVDTRPAKDRDRKPLTIQYRYLDADNHLLNIRRDYKGNYVTGSNEIMDFYDGNLFGSIYIGPNNPSTEMGKPDYRREPQDVVDAAALVHDQMYDVEQAKGVSGALFDTKVLPADNALITSARMAISMYLTNVVDPFTGKETSFDTYVRAEAVLKAFTLTTSGKNIIKGTEDAASSASQGTNGAIDSIADFFSSLKKDISRTVRSWLQETEDRIKRAPYSY